MSYASFKIRFVDNTCTISLKLTLKWLEVLHEPPYNNNNNNNNNNNGNLAWENSRFSSLPAAGDVSRGTRVSCLHMTDKRQKATKVKCKRAEYVTKQSMFVEYILL